MSTGSRWLNRLKVIFDRQFTAADILDKAVKHHPGRQLLYEPAPGPEMRAQTVKEIYEYAVHVGKCLRLAGMKRNDRVAVYKTNAPDYFIYTLAIIRGGGIAVPINAGMPEDTLSRYLNYTGAQFVITDRQQFDLRIGQLSLFASIKCWLFKENAPGVTAMVLDMGATDTGQLPDAGPEKIAATDVAVIVHTSGTTGTPKGVSCTSSALTQGIKKHFAGEPISVNNRVAIAGHFNHLVCLLGMCTALTGNIPVYAFPTHEPAFLLQQIDHNRITIFFAFPDIYLNMYLHGLDQYDLSSVKAWIGTACASHEIHKQAFSQKGSAVKVFGKRLLKSVFIEPLGASEVGFAALQHYYLHGKKMRLKRCIGRPQVNGPKVKVADEEGNPLKAGTAGRLMVKGKTVFAGYWNAPELTAEAITDGWWFTGDIVYKDKLGRYYHMDRLSDVVATTQGDVYSILTEEILLTHPEVGEAVVIGLPHPGKGTVPVAIIHGRSQNTPAATTISEWAKNNLRIAMPLEAVIVVQKDEIPRGLTGKVLKRVLRERYGLLFTASGQA